ncbi:MAG: diaminopimelate epimerase [Corynebacterium sp.]|nr:diaminopimelate epimerase [Corynebacterium sp.]
MDETTEFVKGHGTENDFIIVDDPTGRTSLDAQTVRQLCDRHAGIGADGVLRVVRSSELQDESARAAATAGATWFMDYRNADGSIAEMCGNGSRVFAHYLTVRGYETGAEFSIGTRAGVRRVHLGSVTHSHAEVSVEMGPVRVDGLSTVVVGGRTLAGLAINVGNPHLAAIVPGLTTSQLAELPVDQPIDYDAAFFPEGVNVEIATALHDGVVHMRVHERGVGETRSCGTGTVATAVAALADAGAGEGTVGVHVPGGVVSVTIADGQATLTGPSQLVFSGTIAL